MFLFWTCPEEFPRELSSEPSRLAPPVKDKRHMPSGSFEAPRGWKCVLLRPHGSVHEAQ
ncbi:hypothetical protein CALCODRAFT_503287 [Calocera cornea HHB12733]|uniref:Uncharacterized protein n=1 Tax=Calocera cornea HHB12733 TaxID=1353952 RepID=A0A165CXY3_9BASI|nr:hypothetical protein CALCODRAFT_503287 [Calocera cornea HHB12733]